MPDIEELLNSTENEETYQRISKYLLSDDYSDDVGPIEVYGRTIGDVTEEISVSGEENSQYIQFIMPRYYDGIDLVDMTINIHYELSNGTGSDDYPVNAYYSDEHIKFGWIIPQPAVASPGVIQFCIFAVGEKNGHYYIFKTETKQYNVKQGLNIGTGIIEPDENWYMEFVLRLEGITDDLIAEAKEIVDEYAGQVLDLDSELNTSSAHAIQNRAVANAFLDNYDLIEDTVGWVGKNLLPFPYEDGGSKTANGITFTVNPYGSININGTATANSTYFLIRDTLLTLSLFEKNKKYRFVSNNNNASHSWSGFNLLIRVQNSNDSENYEINYADGEEFSIPSRYFDESFTVRVQLSVLNGVSVSNQTIYPMLYNSNIIDSSYEPYREPVANYIDTRLRDALGNTGKNIIPFPYRSGSQLVSNGITFTANPDGSVVANGTATGEAYYHLHNKDTSDFLTLNKTYIMSSGVVGDESKYYLYMQLRNAEDTQWVSPSLKVLGTADKIEFIRNSSVKYTVSIVIKNGVTVNNLVFKPMIREADILDGTYEPYGNIQNYTDNAIKKAVGWTGKNLISGFSSVVSRGVTFTVNSDGSIKATGTASGGDANCSIDFPLNLLGKRLILSGCPNESNCLINGFRVESTDGQSGTVSDEGRGVEFTFKNGTGNAQIILIVQNGKQLPSGGVTFYPMLREASIKSNEYEPFHESIESVFEEEINGINLLKYPYTDTTKTINGITFTDMGDGSIRANGTATANASYILIDSSKGYNLPSGVYTLTGCPFGGGGNKYFINANFFESGVENDLVDYGNGATKTYINPRVQSPGNIYIRIVSGQTVSNLVFKPMLRKAEIDSSLYHPYNAQSIQNQLNAQYNVLGVKNLIPYPYTEGSKTVSGVTFTVNSDGSITANGTATAGINYPVIPHPSEALTFNETTQLILSGCPSGGSSSTYRLNTRIGNKSDDSYVRNDNDMGSGVSFFVTPNQNLAVNIEIINGTTVNNVVFKPMLRLASIKDDTYIPYAKTNKELTDIFLNGAITSILNGKIQFAHIDLTAYGGDRHTVRVKGEISYENYIITGSDFILYRVQKSPNNVGSICVTETSSAMSDTSLQLQFTHVSDKEFDITNKKSYGLGVIIISLNGGLSISVPN